MLVERNFELAGGASGAKNPSQVVEVFLYGLDVYIAIFFEIHGIKAAVFAEKTILFKLVWYRLKVLRRFVARETRRRDREIKRAPAADVIVVHIVALEATLSARERVGGVFRNCQWVGWGTAGFVSKGTQ